jgi:2-iminobutanoate/2-iminopropanoate deaminase
VYQTFGLRSSVERFFGYLKDRTRAFYNNINPRKTLFMPLVDFLLGAIRCVVHRVEVTRIGLIRTGPSNQRNLFIRAQQYSLMNGTKKIVSSKKAPRPIAPYSQAVLAGEFLFISGNVGVDPSTNKLALGIEEQTRQTLRNIEAVLSEAGLSLNDVIKVTVYIKDLSLYSKMNDVYKEFFPSEHPARTTVGVADLLLNALVEMDAIAYYGNKVK